MSLRQREPGQALRCACGALVEAPRLAASAVIPPPCPRCWQLLQVVELAEGTLHRCPSCAGVFAECRAEAAIHRRGEAALAGAPPPEATPRAVDRTGYARCPICANVMNRVQFARRSGVVVDVCRDHGTWFDADELESVAAFATEQARARPLSGEESGAAATEEERRRAAATLGERLEELSRRGPTAADEESALERHATSLPFAVLRWLFWWMA